MQNYYVEVKNRVTAVTCYFEILAHSKKHARKQIYHLVKSKAYPSFGVDENGFHFGKKDYHIGKARIYGREIVLNANFKDYTDVLLDEIVVRKKGIKILK